MSDQSAAEAAVKPEHGDEVRGGQGHRGQPVEVSPVGGVELESPHGVGKQGRCTDGATPPPYSSDWMATMAAFARPFRRGIPHVWGSASFNW